MKKILLMVAFMGAVLLGKSQIVVLNEIYTDPGSGNSEFFELYNSSGGAINTDCYTVITYYTEGANTGFYVMDLPAGFVPPTGYFVGAAASPFSVQGQSGLTADFNWNAMPATGSLTKWQRTGGTYTQQALTLPLTDFLQKQSGNGAAYHVFVYANGVLVNAFFGGTGSATIPAAIRAMPDLPVDMLGACTDFTARFDAVNLPNNRGEYVTPTPGNDNGYIRKRDGQCGAWDKGAPGINHTPGATNGAASSTGALDVSAVMACSYNQDGNLVLNYSINANTPTEAFPVTIIIYEDLGQDEPGDGTLTPNVNEPLLPNGIFDADDTIVSTTGPYAGISGAQSFIVGPPVSPGAYIFPFPPGGRDSRAFIVVFQTPQGCFDQVRFVTQCAILPVKYKSFTATRNQLNVLLKWETSSEQNSEGFAVERNIGGTWTEIAFVASQAFGGNSEELLTYSYTDPNNLKGITQYRIRQVDLDGKSKLSEIRAVRGLGQIGQTIVYPNPSSDGKVTVVFEDATSARDISLIDMSGRVIKQWKNVTNNNIQIDHLTPGVFSLRIVIPATGEQSVEKIVVNKR